MWPYPDVKKIGKWFSITLRMYFVVVQIRKHWIFLLYISIYIIKSRSKLADTLLVLSVKRSDI